MRRVAVLLLAACGVSARLFAQVCATTPPVGQSPVNVNLVPMDRRSLYGDVEQSRYFVAPGGIVLGQKVLDGVAEALQSNTHRVPGFGFLRAQGFGVKIPGGFESFEREAFGGETPNGHEAGALTQSALEAPPGLLIEFGGDAEGVLSQLRFVGFERRLQMHTDGVGLGGELLYPIVHYLSIAKRAEPAEEFACDLTHGWPGGIGVHLFHHRSDRPAAANGHTKIMDGVCVGGRAYAFQLLNDAVYPEGKAVVLPVGTGGHGSHGSHLENPGRVPSNVPGRDPIEGGVEYLVGKAESSQGAVEVLWKGAEGKIRGQASQQDPREETLSPRNRI